MSNNDFKFGKKIIYKWILLFELIIVFIPLQESSCICTNTRVMSLSITFIFLLIIFKFEFKCRISR